MLTRNFSDKQIEKLAYQVIGSCTAPGEWINFTSADVEQFFTIVDICPRCDYYVELGEVYSEDEGCNFCSENTKWK